MNIEKQPFSLHLKTTITPFSDIKFVVKNEIHTNEESDGSTYPVVKNSYILTPFEIKVDETKERIFAFAYEASFLTFSLTVIASGLVYYIGTEVSKNYFFAHNRIIQRINQVAIIITIIALNIFLLPVTALMAVISVPFETARVIHFAATHSTFPVGKRKFYVHTKGLERILIKSFGEKVVKKELSSIQKQQND